MSGLDLSDLSVLDYGCGTGVLAILAHKMGARDILAIDNDDQAIECARDCCTKNEVDTITLLVADIPQLSHSHYDVILANINRNVLMDRSKEIARRQKSGGILVLSGMMLKDENMVLEAYKSLGYRSDNVLYRGEWVSLLLIKD